MCVYYLVAQDILTFEFCVSLFVLLGIRDIQVLVLISFQLRVRLLVSLFWLISVVNIVLYVL